jgi:hypothetical protein
MFLEGRHFSIACGAEGDAGEIISVETEPTDFALMIYQLSFQLVNFKSARPDGIVGESPRKPSMSKLRQTVI